MSIYSTPLFKSSPSLSNSLIKSNRAMGLGGILKENESSSKFHDVSILGKYTALSGAVKNRHTSSPKIVNALASGNTACVLSGGGIFSKKVGLRLTNLTKTDNLGAQCTFFSQSCQMFPDNHIIWMNREEIRWPASLDVEKQSELRYSNSLVEGNGGSNQFTSSFGIDDRNSIESDPGFADLTPDLNKMPVINPALDAVSNTFLDNNHVNRLTVSCMARICRHSNQEMDRVAFEFNGNPLGRKSRVSRLTYLHSNPTSALTLPYLITYDNTVSGRNKGL